MPLITRTHNVIWRVHKPFKSLLHQQVSRPVLIRQSHILTRFESESNAGISVLEGYRERVKQLWHFFVVIHSVPIR
jgi:hypothetical protein